MKIYIVSAVAIILTIGAIITFKVITSGEQQANLDHQKPMVIFKDKDRLWQVITYSGDFVHVMEVDLYPEFKQVKHQVYLNYRSQFVYSNGSGILFNEKLIFWNRAGDIVLYDGRVVPEEYVFFVNDNEMKSGTALTLFELKEDIHTAIRKNKDIDQLRNH